MPPIHQIEQRVSVVEPYAGLQPPVFGAPLKGIALLFGGVIEVDPERILEQSAQSGPVLRGSPFGVAKKTIIEIDGCSHTYKHIR